jgi:GNAT superfamily N-acetyltransferase
MVTIMIRTAKATDAEEIIRLSAQLGYPTIMEQVKTRIDQFAHDKDSAIFVYEIANNHLAGWIHILGKHLIYAEYAEVGGLVVDKDLRRQGIGLQLIKKSEEWARENNYQEIRLRSGDERKEAHKFYKQIGYTNLKVQQVFALKLD